MLSWQPQRIILSPKSQKTLHRQPEKRTTECHNSKRCGNRPDIVGPARCVYADWGELGPLPDLLELHPGCTRRKGGGNAILKRATCMGLRAAC